MKFVTGLAVVALWLHLPTMSFAAPPKAADNRLIVELVAQEPDIVTPTGVAVDEQGRIWVIENHTHQRPAKYKGPTSDRIRILEDFGPDGKARKITTWADGFKDTMGITLTKNGVLVATRSAIYLLNDTKGTGKADDKKVLAHLETKTTYPHDGLCGFAIDALGDIHFGLGENFGAPYKLIGTDKTTLTGGGEGGSIYRMKPNGSGLTRIATGFWNPFHMTFDRWGRLFAVDNDPDSRGPCRLLHIVQDGDYGYRYKYGRKGIHPFQSWNGELPGTLPMVAGTAEAPSGIVAYESDGLPEEYRGLLMVTSWGDHVIEQFQLEPRGASFGAKKKVMVRGDNNFRPVGIVIAPDGSLIVSDWVDQSYPVHGKGRIWRVRMKERPKGERLSLAEIRKQDIAKLKALLSDPRKEVRFVAAETMWLRNGGWQELKKTLQEHKEPVARLHAFWALIGLSRINSEEYLYKAMADSVPEIRAEAAAQTAEFVANLPIESQPPKKVKPPEEGVTSRVSLGLRILELAMGDPKPGVRLRALEALAKMFTGPSYFHLEAEDPFIANAAIAFAKSGNLEKQIDALSSTKFRLGILLAQRRARFYLEIPKHLNDADPAVRRAAIQWVAEEGLRDYEPHVDKAAAKEPVTREVFEAWLAAKELLANPGNLKDANKELGGDAFVLKIINDAKQPTAFRTMALRMLRPDHGKLTVPTLIAFAKDNDKALQAEAVKTLAWRSDAQSQKTLREIALDPKLPIDVRRDAVLGLALKAGNAETNQVLVKLAKEPDFAADARRGLRGLPAPEGALKSLGPVTSEDIAEHNMIMLGLPEANVKLESPRPKNAAEWQKLLLALKGDPIAGERVFFHSKGPRCYSCHRIDGRGEAVGPDLSRIGAALDRKKLIESILDPSKEIAPAFTTWLVTMTDGKQHTGVIALESFDSTVTLVDAQGKRVVLKITDIEDRVAQKTSIMPADLHALMTRQEFADLLAFLESRK